MISTFLLTSISSVSAINTKTIDAVNVSNEGGGSLTVIVLNVIPIPFILPPAGWAIEVKNENGDIMAPIKYEEGVGIYEPIPLGYYYIKVSADKFKNKYRTVEITKEVNPDDPDTYYQIAIQFKLGDLKSKIKEAPNPFSLFQLLRKMLS
ncbi:MAG TPA: hypothetical protein VGB37_02435 [Candidatus Lokiarchaeia archaeon]